MVPPSLGKYSPVEIQVVTAVQEIASGALNPFGAGVVSIVHVLPFHPSARVAPLAPPVFPIAVQEVADGQDTAVSWEESPWLGAV